MNENKKCMGILCKWEQSKSIEKARNIRVITYKLWIFALSNKWKRNFKLISQFKLLLKGMSKIDSVKITIFPYNSEMFLFLSQINF